jgi:hypothetical protein
MRRSRRWPAIAPLCPLLAVVARAEENDGPRPVTADRDLLGEILAESGVARDAPSAPWRDYATDMTRRFVGGIQSLLGLSDGATDLLTRAIGFGAAALVVAAVVMLAIRVVQSMRASRRPPPTATSVRETRSPGATVGPGADVWRRRLEDALAAGEATRALEALWWWLARSLLARDVDASWTSGELLRAAGRNDLRPPVSRLDALTYGRATPRTPEVRSLLDDLEEALS